MDNKNYIVLDTETTGLNGDDELIELAIINQDREILLNQRFKPTKTAFKDATAIHHISYDDLKSCKTFSKAVIRKIEEIFKEYQTCYIYNASYDKRILEQSAKARGHKIDLSKINFSCVMNDYAEKYGDWNDYHCSFTWVRLEIAYMHAMQVQKKPRGNLKAHSALDDCLMTSEIINLLQNHGGQHD